MSRQNPVTRGPSSLAASTALLVAILSCAVALCGCSTNGFNPNAPSENAKSISVGSITMSYPAEYELLVVEETSELVSEDGSSHTLSRAVVGTEDYAVTYIVEHAEGMTLDEAKSEVNRSMNLLDNPDELDDATRTLAELTIWEPIEETRIDGRAGFVSSSVMYGDTKVITYHVETGPESVGMVTGAIPIDQYDENPESFDMIFSSIKVF